MKVKILALSLVLVVGVTLSPLVNAQTSEYESSNPNSNHPERVLGRDTDNRSAPSELDKRQQELQERLKQAEERLQGQNSRRCDLAKARIEFHRERAAAIREHRQNRYNHIIDRLNALADRMDNNDLDSSELRTSIQELTSLVATYSSSFNNYEVSLQQVLNSACSNPADARQMSAEARQAIVALKSNAESIHTFFQDQLKPQLEDIKEAVKAGRQADNQETDQAQTTEEEEEE